MKFQSTRGGTKNLSFEEVVMSGYAADGGMFMPMTIPKLSDDVISSWSTLSYIDIVKEIAKLYIDDEIPASTIEGLIDTAFTTFKDPLNPIVTKQLNSGITLLELFHGKSLAFKDLSMCCTAQFMQYFIERSKRKATLLIATSGDTGSSALEAISAVKSIDIIVLLPKDRISRVQELQMTTVVGDNCHVIRADGTSDDTDVPIKKVFSDEEFVKTHQLGTLNSVNWCRMMTQMAHHFYSYYQGKNNNPDQETAVFLPTGGLGNATAACIAHKMGLPLRVVCAVTNDALYRAVYDDDYSVGELNVSLAPAMNIQVPYNWERILYVLSDMNTDMVRQLLSEYETKGKTTTPPEILTKLRSVMEVMTISDKEILDTVRQCYDENNGYTICPHTATGLCAALRYKVRNENFNLVCFGVASPIKFKDIILKSGVEWTGRNLIEELEVKTTKYVDWEADEDWYINLRTLIQDIN